MKKILLIATGGTIACKRTDSGLTPLLTSDDLIAYVLSPKHSAKQMLSSCSIWTVPISGLNTG